MLSDLQNRFLDLLLESGALKFGEFKTKSGRTSPFFLNFGAFDHGAILRDVAKCYAGKILEFADNNSLKGLHLYGPAYKGITLASAAAMEVASMTGREVPFTFNRKEIKDHGEGGHFVGRAINQGSEVIIVEDVITGGTSIRETMSLMASSKAKLRGVVVGVDRMERGTGVQRASREIEVTFNVPVSAILTIEDIVSALWQNGQPLQRLGKIWINSELKANIEGYRKEWGG